MAKKDIERVRLGDVSKINYGTRVRSKDSTSDRYPVYGGGGKAFGWSDFNRENQCVVSRFAMSEECVRFVSGKFFLNDSGLTVDANINKIRQEYLNWFLLGHQKKIYSLGRGCAQKNLKIDSFYELIIPLPSLAEQKRIAAELDKIVAMKKNAEERLEKLNLLIKARFNEMFGKDKNFPIVKLGEVVDLVSGTSYSKKDVTKSGIRILRGGNVHADSTIMREEDDVFVSVKYKDVEKSPRSEDIVIVASTGSAAVIGRAGIPEDDMPDSQIGAFLRIVRPREKSIAAYLKLIFLSNVYKKHIEESVNGTNIKNIKANYILDFKISLPPLPLQRTFASFVEKVESLKSIARREAEKLDLLYRSKLQEYFG